MRLSRFSLTPISPSPYQVNLDCLGVLGFFVSLGQIDYAELAGVCLGLVHLFLVILLNLGITRKQLKEKRDQYSQPFLDNIANEPESAELYDAMSRFI